MFDKKNPAFNALITHLMMNNMEEIMSKSLLDCHCKGLHSIMLSESPQKTIRMFVVDDPTHMMLNHPDHMGQSGKRQTLAFHPHHCNLTLHCIAGEIFNWTIKPAEPTQEDQEKSFWISEWKYQSQILTGELGFTQKEQVLMREHDLECLEPGDSVFMPAHRLHTVSCFKPSAWLVFEGKENPDYESVCYSNADLSKPVDPELYRSPDWSQLSQLFTLAGIFEPE